jgi:hypothetical protein
VLGEHEYKDAAGRRRVAPWTYSSRRAALVDSVDNTQWMDAVVAVERHGDHGRTRAVERRWWTPLTSASVKAHGCHGRDSSAAQTDLGILTGQSVVAPCWALGCLFFKRILDAFMYCFEQK